MNDRAATSIDERTSSCSILIIVSLFLLSQWLNILKRIVSSLFTTLIYHDSFATSLSKIYELKKRINAYLTQRNDVFDEFDEENVSTIIFIVSQTWTTRHDSNAQKIWRITKDEKNQKKLLKSDWKRNLSDRFRNVIIDKAHIIKNISFQITIVIDWLNPQFIALLIETFVLKNFFDFLDYLRLLKASDSHTWWRSDSLRELDQAHFINSFIIAKSESETKLQFTKYVVKEFLINQNYDSFTQKIWLQKLYKHFLLKKTHASRISFDFSTSIDENLSKLKFVQIDCVMTNEKYQLYRDRMQLLLKKWRNDKWISIAKWSFAVQRKMYFVIAWLNVFTLKKNSINLMSEELKKSFINKKRVTQWFNIVTSKYNASSQLQLFRMYKKDFKLRALLRNIRFQISCWNSS